MRILTVTGIFTARRMAARMRSAFSGSRMSAEPSPFLTIFGAGQPMLKSRMSAVPSDST